MNPSQTDLAMMRRALELADEASAMRRFHEEMASNYSSVCVPTPDGLAVGIRLDPNA